MVRLGTLLDHLSRLRVLVVGDVLLDDYLHGDSPRICREAPVPAVTVTHRRPVPGGAGNLAANVAALGASVQLLSVVGDDADGAILAAALRDRAVGLDHLLVHAGRRTVSKRRVVADGQLLFRLDEGAPEPLTGSMEDQVVRRLEALFPVCDAVLVSDYGYGALGDRVLAALRGLHHRTGRVLVVDARATGRYRDIHPTAVKPNYDEARTLLGNLPERPSDRASVLVARCDELLDATGAAIVASTLDRDGALVCERGRPPYRTYTRPTTDWRACGAGDSFTAALGLALAAGASTTVAAELAQAAATVVVGRDGTSICSADDLSARLAGTSTRLEDRAALAWCVASHRRHGRRVVFTNGRFDQPHRGHIDLLNRARGLGDVLVVGLNSDDSIRRLQGPGRPVRRLGERAQVLAALSCVDHLAAFDGATAADLIELVRPDVYVKGGDYTAEMVPEAPLVEAHGGVVRILPYLEDRSADACIEPLAAPSPADGRGVAMVPAEAER